MTSVMTGDVDLIDELRMRRWARENYVPRSERQNGWHWVVLDEMTKKDVEGPVSESSVAHSTWLKS